MNFSRFFAEGRRALAVAAIAFGLFSVNAHAQDYESSKAEAERQFEAKSYAAAREIYQELAKGELTPENKRWVEFRLADTRWRSQAGTQTADPTVYDESQKALEILVRDISRVEDRDRVWIEAQESLGDFYWVRNDSRNWGAAWPFYQNALDGWAGSATLELARDRYIKIVKKIARPVWAEPQYYYGYYGNQITPEIAENYLKIAQASSDKAHAHYLFAMTLRSMGDWDSMRRVAEEFEAAIAAGESTDWHDDALFNYAQWMEQGGRIKMNEDGSWRREPDFPKAVALYRRIMSEHQKGESRYFDQAKSQVANITSPQLWLGIGNVFAPDAEIEFQINWRNVKRVDFSIYKMDLVRDAKFPNGERDQGQNWLDLVSTDGLERMLNWSLDTEDKGEHIPGGKAVRPEQKLPVGAYLVIARGEDKSARELLLVSDAALTLKTSGRKALLYFCDAWRGAPLAEANVRLIQRYYQDDKIWTREYTATTNADGIALIEMQPQQNMREIFAAGALGDRQAFSTGHAYWNPPSGEYWKIYAYTDKTAYRPDEEVKWKALARTSKGEGYVTPSDRGIEYEITNPQGAKVGEGKSRLNAFGSVWGTLQLTKAMPLGEYQIQFWDEGRRNFIGGAQLFRLEEYKLPEFKVTIQTPEEDGKKKAFRIGETVEVSVQADYYFGGAVANADAEIIVYQNPYYHYWFPIERYPWYFDDMRPNYRNYGGGQVIKRETVKTDATGKATLSFETPRGSGQDFEYRIEARVTDASRREITASDSIRVTRQRYYVNARPEHNIHRPQDKVQINFDAQDANNQPMQVEGTVRVTRDYWYEIWLDYDGKEIKGDALALLQKDAKIFPPPPDDKGRRWKLKFRGYQHDDILKRELKTDKEGKAELTFTPEREGYYRAAWTSFDHSGEPIRAETVAWVASNATTELGFRYQGVQIVADKETFRVGQKVPIMINVPTNDRYVLFSVEGEDLYDYRLIHFEGTTKLIEMDVVDKHTPNIFLSAAMIGEGQIFMDTKQIIVPPDKNFIEVKIEPDRALYQPRDEGKLQVTTLDADGKPVAAEVALAVVDESVFYIQSDLAEDPRKFFYGQKRYQQVQTQSTFNWKSYISRRAQDREDEMRRSRNESVDDGFYAMSEMDAVGGIGGDADGNVAYFADARQNMAFKSKGGRMGALGAAVAQEAGAAMPASAPARMAMEKKDGGAKEAGDKMQEAVVVVRSDFRSSIFWQPDLATDKNGKAEIKIAYPDSLTAWRTTARAAGTGGQVGMGSGTTRTRQPLIARLQAPRFFVVGDLCAVSAVYNNNTDAPMTVTPKIEVSGLVISGLMKNGKPVKGEAGPIKIEPNSEARMDWAASVQNPGEVKIKVTGVSGKYADAMEKTYEAVEHGIEKFIGKSGKTRAAETAITLDLPKERKAGSTTLTVQLSPSLAVTMLDALPYLIGYPYGCTEQTMSRFLPAVITLKTLRDLKLNPEEIAAKIFGGIEEKSVNKTQPNGKKNLAELDAMVNAGLERLYGFQHGDGGWGWWKEGESDHFMTAYVVWGMSLAREAGIEIKNDSLSRAAAWLDLEIVEEEESPDMQAWMLHALARNHAGSKATSIAPHQAKALENLWNNRDKLNAYARSLLALAAKDYGDGEKAKTLIQNLENGVKKDDKPDTSVVMKGGAGASDPNVMATAHYGEDGIYWRWSEGGVEATAFALRAILAVDPKHKLVEPVMNWLVKNRRGAQWSNTRDTAIVVLAMNDYLRASGELTSEGEYDLTVNGTKIASRKITPTDILAAPSRFEIDPKLIGETGNEIRIARKGGESPLYFSVEGKFYSLEEPIKSAGSEIFARREYRRITTKKTLLKGFVEEKSNLKPGDAIQSGDRIETIVTIESKNNYEYLIFEDLKPAGFEAVAVRSGEPLYAQEIKSGALARRLAGPREPDPSVGTIHDDASRDRDDLTGRSQWVYQELRDRKVAMFMSKLPEGVWEIRYMLRAETPGEFHALPLLGHAMYVPEIRCNGEEERIQIVE